MGTKQIVNIPPRIEGMTIIKIGDNAFRGKDIIKITIPNSVTSIEAGAFAGCTSLASVSIGNRVTSIEAGTFAGCTSLASVSIGNRVTSIEAGAFYGCTGLASVTIPNSVTSIGHRAFEGCTSLASVTIPTSVTSIEAGAFLGCSSLASITVDRNNPNYASEGGILYNKAKTTLIKAPQGISGAVTIPNSVIDIEDSAFEGCNNLASVTIPDSVTSIGTSAFEGCSSLTSVTIPDSVIDIKSGTFRGCSSLASVTIGNSVTSIGHEAFKNCTNLASVTIGNSVTSIGYGAFVGCSSLASVSIGNGVTYIGEEAFRGCHSLASVTFKGTVSNWELPTFLGDLRTKYLAAGGGPGTYITANPGEYFTNNIVWTKQSASSLNTQASENTGTVTHPDNAKRVVTSDTTRLKWKQELGRYDVLNLRSEPSTRGSILAELSRGDEVTILETGAAYTDSDGISGNWVRVRYGNIVGWCFSGYLDIP